MRCNSCEVVYINGVRCHEHGCPDAWRDKKIECGWCGIKFQPENRHQNCCDEYCWAAYNGIPTDDEDENYDE